MSAKHTPGPWAVRVAANGSSVAVMELRSGAPVALAKSDHPNTKGRKVANARLLATAPDLLAAVIEARDLIAGNRTGVEWKRACAAFVVAADAAIAKASPLPEGVAS